MSGSNFGGATINRKQTLRQDEYYTASFDIDPGTFQTQSADGLDTGIQFQIREPDGRLLDSSNFLQSSYIFNDLITITYSLFPSTARR